MPASRALSIMRCEEASSVGPPNIMAPRQSGDTLRPLRPSLRYSTAAPPLLDRHLEGRQLFPIQATLETLTEKRERPAQEEVKAGHQTVDNERAEGRIVDHLCGARKLSEANNRGQRGAFENLHEKTDGRRDGDADRLRQDDETQLLQMAEPKGMRPVPLPARDGLDAAAPYLTEECARVERQCQGRRQPGIGLDAKEAGAEVEQIELHEQRGALENFDVAESQCSQQARLAHPQDGDPEPHRASTGEGDQ